MPVLCAIYIYRRCTKYELCVSQPLPPPLLSIYRLSPHRQLPIRSPGVRSYCMLSHVPFLTTSLPSSLCLSTSGVNPPINSALLYYYSLCIYCASIRHRRQFPSSSPAPSHSLPPLALHATLRQKQQQSSLSNGIWGRGKNESSSNSGRQQQRRRRCRALGPLRKTRPSSHVYGTGGCE